MIETQTLFSTGLSPASMEQAVLCLMTAFVLGSIIAFVYQKTYQGLSYSRSFVQSLILGAIVATILMLAIGDNLARGLGILGTMALVRFRTNVRDSRDMIFVFAALSIGIASGVRAFSIACVGTAVFALAALVVEWSPMGRTQRFDGMLRFWLPRDAGGAETIRAILGPHCRSFVLVAVRDVGKGDALEYAYQVKLKNQDTHDTLVDSLADIPGIGGLTLMLQDAHTEL
ncbi:MAG: DUF4956 domain-containing protein [Myxococcales bacterium]|nr:DUF4956 domain-containing protein [Myxococcales bacterium]